MTLDQVVTGVFIFLGVLGGLGLFLSLAFALSILNFFSDALDWWKDPKK